MRTSDSIAALAAALAKAQASMAGAKKDATNPHFRSRYADLASVWEACRDALTRNGLSVVQMTEPQDGDSVCVTTRLMHASGEWIEGDLVIPVVKADAQGYGSALTYARRYALAAAVGVAPEDDDGNAAAAAKPDRSIPANIEGRDAWEGYDNATRDMLSGIIAKTIELHESQATGGDPAGYLRSQGFDDETKLAVWSQLPSHVRAAIKKADRASLASQP